MSINKNSVVIVLMTIVFGLSLCVSAFCFSGAGAHGHEATLVESHMVKELSDNYGRGAFLVEARGDCISGKQEEIGLSAVSWSRDDGVDRQLSSPKIEDDLNGNGFLNVRRFSSGVVLIRWTNVSSYVLQQNLPEVRFSDYFNQTAPAYIINKLWYSKAMLDQLKSGRVDYVGPPLGVFSSARDTDTERRLDGKMNDVSVEDVLIKVASTFGGIIFYAECPRHGGVDYYVNYYYPKNW